MENKENRTVPIQYIPVQYETDEIDLKELFKTLWRYRIFIMLFTLVVTIAAAVYSMVATQIYETRADIQIGYISNSNSNSDSDSNSKVYLINPYAAKIYIHNNFAIKDNKTASYPNVNVNFVKKTKDILTVKILDISNESGKKYLDKILDAVKKQEEQKLKSFIDNITNQIKLLQNQKNKYKKELRILKTQLTKTKDPTIYQTLLDNIRSYQKDILNLELKIGQLESQISPINITKTHVIGKVIQNDYPIKPKKKLIVTVAFVTGLIFSIFLVFFIEFAKSFKEER